MLVQLRTQCIGLRKFLYDCRVLEIGSPRCNCQGGEETAEHIALFCPLESSRRHLLLDECGRRQSWETLIGTPSLARRITKWFIESGRIKQFTLANKLLYQSNT